jgi:hypothetical protein
MYIFVTTREALLNISGILLTTKNGYNSEGFMGLEAEIARMQSSFECIKKDSPKNGVVRVEHANDIKSDVFYVRVFWGAK